MSEHKVQYFVSNGTREGVEEPLRECPMAKGGGTIPTAAQAELRRLKGMLDDWEDESDAI